MRTLMPVNKRLHLSNSQMKERGSICSVLSRWWRLQPVDACLERPQTDRHIHRLDLTQQSCRKLNYVTFFFVFVFVGELSAVPRFQTTSGIEGGDTFTQREHLFSQSPVGCCRMQRCFSTRYLQQRGFISTGRLVDTLAPYGALLTPTTCPFAQQAFNLFD